MQNLYYRLTLRKLLLFSLVILFAGISKMEAQCTLTIPAISTTSNYNYCGSTAYTVPKTTEAYYGPHYTWVCPGDTIDFIPDPTDGNEQCCGAVILEPGAVFILEYGAAGWTVWAKAGSSFINHGSVNGNNFVISEPGAYVTPGFNSGTGSNNYCASYQNATCSQLIYDYSLILPGTGCFASTAPATQFSANPVTVCAGDSVTFTDQSTGSPTSWHWTFTGGKPANSTVQNPGVHYDTAGTYAVKLVVTNSSGSDSLTKTGYITVNPLPVAGAITGPDAMCAGDSAQLSDTGSSGIIQWQSSADGISFANITGSIFSVDSVNGLMQTTYYRVTASNGCGTDSSSAFKLLVNALPVPAVAAVDSLICSSDSTQVCTSGNFVSYSWNTTDTTKCIAVKAAGNYYVSVTDNNGCAAQSNSVAISVFPVTSVSIIQNGDTLSSFGQVSYHWLLNGNPISSATGQFCVVNGAGSYSVAVIDSNGCAATSNAIVITGVSDLTKEGLSLFPNPSTGTWQLTVGNELMGSSIDIYDDNGRIVFQSEVGNLKSAIYLEVARGIYWLRISNAEVSVVRKMVKL